ncbi:MAG TPA: UDP-N-acetylmuramoyl-L-alanyl-D-glutamate--2,6-diaminopimelate ligase [Dehalococcoidia bacterium]|nr:UDP-N-acetylmuramoyl-L-alanyl-D-glutamate--2,6-diaminopimelate ligase [Dehalococcoidia bacterium]
MLLADLLRPLGIAVPAGGEREISGIAYDSRRVQPGGLFVAIPGFHVDGAAFVGDACARGAAAVVLDELALPAAATTAAAAGVPLFGVADPRAALATLSACWFGYPARDLVTIGVTGTDGKTTTCYLTSSLLEAAGFRTGLFTTVAYKVGGQWEENESRQTTPEALEVQQLLRRMADAGVGHALLESTSHGLELHKLDHCEYDIAVFTNLSPDHLDFHGTVEAYAAAKARLFAMLDTSRQKGAPKLAVLNADDPHWQQMANATSGRRLTYALDAPADLRAVAIDLQADGSELRIASPAGPIEARLNLPGRFNVANALAAAAVALGLDVPAEAVGEALSRASGVPGRMQRIDTGQPFTVIVDYAHTAASFQKVLDTLRPLTRGRLIAVFGCAGERGAERRSGMGTVAARSADYAVLTSEDPREEDPAAIIAEIAAAMAAAGAPEGQRFERIVDRREAIGRAFALAGAGDVVLLTGKGHEHSIQTARGSIPWDEAAVATELLRGAAPAGD